MVKLWLSLCSHKDGGLLCNRSQSPTTMLEVDTVYGRVPLRLGCTQVNGIFQCILSQFMNWQGILLLASSAPAECEKRPLLQSVQFMSRAH